MIRALLELIVTLIVVMAARAILGSFMRGFVKTARTNFDPAAEAQAAPRPRQPNERASVAGELHKDPVCGMYVAESTRFQRSSGRDRFYYCSEECKEKHAVAAR